MRSLDQPRSRRDTSRGGCFRFDELTEQRQPGQRIGLRFGAETRELQVDGNRIEGFAVAVDDRRAK